MTCPNCGAAMRLKADQVCLVCDYCRSIHFPEPNSDGVRVLIEDSELACPVCAVSLFHAAIAGQRIRYCQKCRGMLISMDFFMAILHDLRSRRQAPAEVSQQPDWKDLERRIQCPQCREVMDTHPYGGGGNVIMDSCENCALNWLDYSELGRIVRAADREFTVQLGDSSPVSP